MMKQSIKRLALIRVLEERLQGLKGNGTKRELERYANKPELVRIAEIRACQRDLADLEGVKIKGNWTKEPAGPEKVAEIEARFRDDYLRS